MNGCATWRDVAHVLIETEVMVEGGGGGGGGAGEDPPPPQPPSTVKASSVAARQAHTLHFVSSLTRQSIILCPRFTASRTRPGIYLPAGEIGQHLLSANRNNDAHYTARLRWRSSGKSGRSPESVPFDFFTRLPSPS